MSYLKEFFFLNFSSIYARRGHVLLSLISLSLAIYLLFAVERIRNGAKAGFTNTISQVDLIVGAKGGSLQLLLYTVFRLGSATDNISYKSYQDIQNHPAVAWTIPYSLGDSHRGFRVVGTNENFYEHYRYRGDKKIEMEHGERVQNIQDVVLGAQVAKELNYKLGDSIHLEHGIQSTSFYKHEDQSFKISGILKATGTPIDRSIYTSLEAIEWIHVGWEDGAPPSEEQKQNLQNLTTPKNFEIKQITSFLLRTKNRIEVLRLQNEIQNYEEESLMAIIPGVMMSELWNNLSYFESTLWLISVLVIVIGLISMAMTLLQSQESRSRELAIYRSLGASLSQIFWLYLFESLFLGLASIVNASFLIWLTQLTILPWLGNHFGILIPYQTMSYYEWIASGFVLLAGALLSLIPAIKNYYHSLSEGLQIRI